MTDDIFHDLPAPPLHPEEREEIAEKWLTSAQQTHGGAVDVMAIIKAMNINIVECAPERMADNQAYARPQVNSIFVQQIFNDELRRRLPEALFRLAHEIAHCILHRGLLAKPLKVGGNVPLSWKPAEERQEDQAWDLGRSIMLPRMHIKGDEDAMVVAKRFCAPKHHVELRLAQLRRERRKLRKPSNDLPAEARKVWEQAQMHADFDSDFTRLSKSGLRVDAASYNRLDQPFGWYILYGKIYSRDEAEFW